MKPIHLEGMGVIGSALAWRLYAENIKFTWNDNLQALNSWQSSTGMIYPGSHPRDWKGYLEWAEWNKGTVPICTHLIPANYWYCTMDAPHGGKSQPLTTVGPLKCHALPSYHLNTQQFVLETRKLFSAKQLARCPSDSRLVVAHGFNSRLTRYVWGWSQKVRLDVSQLQPKVTGVNHAIYLRPGLTVMAYAYPVPGEKDTWYAGSSLIPQKHARYRHPEDDVARWRERWDKYTGGVVPIVEELGPVLQGWRPSTGPVSGEDNQPLWQENEDGSLVVMPLWHSGVRWLPLVVQEFLEKVRN